jgi:hypothetical protein
MLPKVQISLKMQNIAPVLCSVHFFLNLSELKFNNRYFHTKNEIKVLFYTDFSFCALVQFLTFGEIFGTILRFMERFVRSKLKLSFSSSLIIIYSEFLNFLEEFSTHGLSL